MRTIVSLAVLESLACSASDSTTDLGASRSGDPAPGAAGTANAAGAGPTSEPARGWYRIGAAKADITGPFAEASTGYNSPGDEMSGLAMHLYSRAFVIEEPGAEIVALVTAEQLHMYQSVKVGVVKKLAADGYGDVFRADNVVLSATHTHAATSNIAWYTLFNLFNGVQGFDELHYQVVVAGIADSIERAYEGRRTATIKMASGSVSNAAHNRSSLAYAANPDAADYRSDVEEQMTLLRFDGEDGVPLGVLSWFGVHGTSLGIDNRRIHGDNKGYAAYQFEKRQGGEFVAAFAQAPMGDVSPNLPNPGDRTLPFSRPSDLDPELDALENPIVHGQLQLDAAIELFETASQEISGPIAYRHSHVDFNHVPVAASYVGNHRLPWDAPDEAPATCVGVVGGGFLAGDEEGAPVEFAKEGEIKNSYEMENGQWVQHKYELTNLDGAAAALGVFWPLASATLQNDQYDACQREKLALLPVGEVDDFWLPNPEVPFVPVIIPLQLVRLGSFAVAATPFELSTMTGRRLRHALAPVLSAAGVRDLVVAAMANSYGQYLTTREEYAEQHFEGAFTLYGPWSEAALTQELDRIAQDLAAGRSSEAGPNPPDLADEQTVKTPISRNGVFADGGELGAVLEEPAESYSAQRARVVARFQAAHPRTVLQAKMDGVLGSYYEPDSYTYLEVQRLVDGTWQRVADDRDPLTAFDWMRVGGDLSDRSEATIVWLVRDQEPGTYRIVYNGLAKRALQSELVAFSGASRPFALQ